MFLLLACVLSQVPDTMMIGEPARRPVVSSDGCAWFRVGALPNRAEPTVKSGLVWGRKRPDGLITWEPADQDAAWAKIGKAREPLTYHAVDRNGAVWESTDREALAQKLAERPDGVPVYSMPEPYWPTPKTLMPPTTPYVQAAPPCLTGQCPRR